MIGVRKKRIYWDTSATTPLDPQVEKVMKPFSRDNFANTFSLHQEGVWAKKALEEAREKISKIIKSHPDEIIFTSGGTESDNLAILGLALNQESLRSHLITSKIEHKAVLEPSHYLGKRGYQVTYLTVDEDGVIDLDALKKTLNKETFLVSIMMANNEIGTIQPIREVAKIIRKWRKDNNTIYPYFHTDACQAPRFMSLNVEQLGVDLLSLSGSKIYGPKGVGALYVRRGVILSPLITGGAQEAGRRAGTHNVAGAVGLAEALNLCEQKREKEIIILNQLRDELIGQLKSEILGLKINGGIRRKNSTGQIEDIRLPNNINFSIEGLEGEQLVLELDAKGFAVSAGSACSFGGDEGSYVIRALGYDEKRVLGEVRISFGREVKKNEITYFTKVLKKIVKKYTSLD